MGYGLTSVVSEIMLVKEVGGVSCCVKKFPFCQNCIFPWRQRQLQHMHMKPELDKNGCLYRKSGDRIDIILIYIIIILLAFLKNFSINME